MIGINWEEPWKDTKSKRVRQIISEGILLGFVVVVLSAGIFLIKYDSMDKSGYIEFDAEKQEEIRNPPPSLQELLPIILPIVIIDILLILGIYRITLRKIKKRELLEQEIKKLEEEKNKQSFHHL